jgi:hypothetical protein
MLMKVSAALLSLMLFSGCCTLFGICTSVSVHTSADSSDKYVREDGGKLNAGDLDSGRDLALPLTSTVELPVLSDRAPVRCTQKSG